VNGVVVTGWRCCNWSGNWWTVRLYKYCQVISSVFSVRYSKLELNVWMPAHVLFTKVVTWLYYRGTGSRLTWAVIC